VALRDGSALIPQLFCFEVLNPQTAFHRGESMAGTDNAENDLPLEDSMPEAGASLESILCTEELQRRPSRPPDYEKENRALVKLVSALADSPRTIFQTLAETIQEITQCDSAGLSLLTRDGKTPNVDGQRFYWPAICGMWNPHVGGGTPRNFGPCGDVLDQNRTLLFTHFEKRYPYLLPVSPAAEECLLVPFYVNGKAVGTIWGIMHSDRRRFDAEDDRVMASLGKFASSAYQALRHIEEALKIQIAEREKAEAQVRAEIGIALAQKDSLRGILDLCAKAIVRHLDATFARIWTLNRDGGELELQASAGLYTRLDGGYSRIAFGKLKIGFIAQERRPHLTNDVQSDPWVDHDWARAENITSFAGYPLIVEDRIVGVMGMFSRKSLTQEVLNALTFISDGIAQCIERKQAEEQLRRSEAKIRRLVEANVVGIVMWNLEGAIVGANEAFLRMVQYSSEDLASGRVRWTELTPAQWRDCDKRAIVELNGSGVFQPYEKEFFRKDGSRVPVLLGGALFERSGNEGVAFVLDLTEQKRQESARLYSDERYRVVVETASDAVVSIDDRGLIVFANPAAATIFGYKPTALLGKPLTLLMPEYMRELHRNGFERYLATGQRHLNWQGTELTALRKNGEEFPVEVSFGQLTIDGHKIFTGFLRDISKRKKAEQALRRSEAFLAEGQRLGQIGSYSWRAATGEITWSEQLYRIYELEIGVPVTLELIRTRVHPDDVTLYEKMVEQAPSGGKDFEWQYRLMMPDHSIKYLQAVARATRDPDGQLEYIAAIQDVTARRLSEEARDKARSELAHVARMMSLGTLAASIAHEINQPLSGIVTNASTCLRMLGADPPKVDGARETARRTIRDANRASEVIARLRALYGKKEFTTESVDLNEATQEVIALSLNELQRNRVNLRPELADELPLVAGDRVALQQVILNLVRNASDAMSAIEDRPRDLVIRTERDEGDRVRLSVKDTGAGLEPQAAERLFEAFYTTKSDGMGMGLSVSRSIIEAHQGRLWATANDGPGARFSFSIPCAANTKV